MVDKIQNEGLSQDVQEVLEVAPLRGSLPTAMCIGDSLMANGWGPLSGTDKYGKTRGWVNWLCSYLNQDVWIKDSFAVGGTTSAQIVTQYDTNIKDRADKPQFVFISMGGNDLLNDPTTTTVDAVIADYEYLIGDINSKGMYAVVLSTGAIRNGMTSAYKQSFSELNVWLREYATVNHGLILIDGMQTVLDPESASGLTYAEYLYDDAIHYSALGAQRIGKFGADVMRQYVPKKEPFYVSGGDIYGRYPNLSHNPVMLGGTTLPTGWQQTSSGTITSTPSKVAADADDKFQGNWLKLNISGGTTGATSSVYSALSVAPNVGDKYYAQVEFKAENLNEIAGIYTELRFLDSGGGMLARTRSMQPDPSDGSVVDHSGVMRTPELEVPVGTTDALLVLHVVSNDDAVGASGEVYFRRNEARVMLNP